MKLLPVFSVILASGLASPFPIGGIDPSTDLLDVRSINEANLALQTLDRRFNAQTCRTIGTTIASIGTSAAKVAFVNGALGLARQICQDEGSPECARYIGYITSGLNLIFVYQAYAHGAVGEGDSGTQGSQADGSVKRSSLQDWADLESALKDSGYSFDSVEHADIATMNLAKRNGQPVLAHRSILRNFTGESGLSSDVAFNRFDNGDMNMDYAGDLGALSLSGQAESTGEQVSGGLAKRYDGAGFKISWTSRISSHLTRAHQQYMSQAIANDWGSRAVATDEGDYFGLVKTDHTANFYFRIIPEFQGFGLNYESVNLCGGMAGFL